MKPKPGAQPSNNQKTAENVENGAANDTTKVKLMPNEVRQNHRTGNTVNASPATLREFLHNKLPRKKVSDNLVSSIKEKIKAFHLL